MIYVTYFTILIFSILLWSTSCNVKVAYRYSDYNGYSGLNEHVVKHINDLPFVSDESSGQIKNIKYDKLRILEVDVSNIVRTVSNKNMDLIGFKFTFNGEQSEHHSYAISYPTVKHFGNFKSRPMLCSIHQCDIGVLFIDRSKDANALHSTDHQYPIQNAIVVVLKTELGRIELYRVNYNVNNIRISVCPYTEWIARHNILKYEPESYIKSLEDPNPTYGQYHIKVPVYPRKNGDTFFSCGKLIQPNKHTIQIGFQIKYDSVASENKAPLRLYEGIVDINCQIGDDLPDFEYFALIKSEYSHTGQNEMIRVNGSEIRQNFYYSKQIFFIYKRRYVSFDSNLGGHTSNNIEHRLKEDINILQPNCFRELSDTVSMTIMPRIINIDNLIVKTSETPYNYITITNDNISIENVIECLGYKLPDSSMKNQFIYFYSKAAKFVVKRNDILMENDKFLVVRGEIKSFGKYSCFAENKTTAYFDDKVSFDDIYVFPASNLEISFAQEGYNKTGDKYPSCSLIYKYIGELKMMSVEVKDSDSKIVMTNAQFLNFETETNQIKKIGNEVWFKDFKTGEHITVKCTYKTLINTEFGTKREYIDAKILNLSNSDSTAPPNGTPPTPSSNLMIIFVASVVFIVFLCGLSIVITVYILRKRKRTKKRKASMNSSVSSSESSISSTSGITESKNSASSNVSDSSSSSISASSISKIPKGKGPMKKNEKKKGKPALTMGTGNKIKAGKKS
uniref:Ig-like domain-containing protein n=1 Tax=Parastrongyloides trichosuri TaxID=131310 RepID=A0A0N4Z137_PARTI